MKLKEKMINIRWQVSICINRHVYVYVIMLKCLSLFLNDGRQSRDLALNDSEWL